MLASIWKPSERLQRTEKRALIYFVSGNPGLIGFYADFLDGLRNLLDASQTHTAWDVYGRNLVGFCDDEHEPFGPGNPPADLDTQVESMYADVAARRASSFSSSSATSSAAADDYGQDTPYDFVVLMGHSVGAYICVEMLHRHGVDPAAAPHLDLRHAFLLFPTIASLGLSTAGARFNFLRGLPTMEVHMATYARVLLLLLPRGLLRRIAARLLGFSASAADLTAEWLKSRDGVRQALHMGVCELDTIFEDSWGDRFWDEEKPSPSSSSSSSSSSHTAGSSPPPPPRFFFFYGREDHWVADHVRDAFVERRRRHGGDTGTTSITVDEGSIPHAFCTREDTSWMVARRVAGWVGQIDGVVL